MTATFQIDQADMNEALSRLATKGNRISIDPETVENDLARLVLGLMEFLRQLIDRKSVV